MTASGAEIIQRAPICDFTAQVVAEEVTEPEGEDGLGAAPPSPAEERLRWFTIQGATLSGKQFSARLSATTLGDPRALRTALLSVIGTEGVVYPKMELHLAAALLKCTLTPPRLCRQHLHLGWGPDGVFLISGRLPADMTLAVASDVPYRLEPDADLDSALKALAALLRAHDLRRTTIAALAVFTLPAGGPGRLAQTTLCALHRRRHGQPEKLLVHGAHGHLGAALHRRPWLRQVRREGRVGHRRVNRPRRGAAFFHVRNTGAVTMAQAQAS